MIIDTAQVKAIYLSNEYVDMRKSINGLSVMVNQYFEMDVLDRSIFIFTNKARNRVKILYYENNGFWLLMKRMEHGRFKIYEDKTSKVKSLDSRQLNWLLEGFEIDQINSKIRTQNRLVI